MITQNTVLVVGCHVSGYGVIRGLGGKNIRIVAMVYGKTDFGDVSRYVSEVVNIPHPRKEDKKFINFLISNAHKWHGALIIDTDDDGAVTISKNKKELSKYYKIPTVEWDILRKFIVKTEAHKIANKCNVPHPNNFLPKTLQELSKMKGELKYPCILKPVYGHEFYSLFRIKNFEVNNYNELYSKFKLCLEHNQEVMVQEIIPGPDTNLYKMETYINSKGNFSAKYFMNKIRQNPPIFGVGRVAVSIERNEEVEILSERLIKHSRYKGFCSIELKKDPRDNQLKLMEVNVRMTRHIMLPIASGVNFPLLIYKDLVENEQIKITNYKKNGYWIELHSDLYNTIFQRKKENFTLRDYLTPYLSKNKVFAVLTIHDLKPFLKLNYVLLLRVIKKFIFRTKQAQLIN